MHQKLVTYLSITLMNIEHALALALPICMVMYRMPLKARNRFANLHRCVESLNMVYNISRLLSSALRKDITAYFSRQGLRGWFSSHTFQRSCTEQGNGPVFTRIETWIGIVWVCIVCNNRNGVIIYFVSKVTLTCP